MSDESVGLAYSARGSLERLRAALDACDDVAVALEVGQLGELLDTLLVDLTLRIEPLE